MSALRRAGFPLDPGWPAVADEAYEVVSEFLWPDDEPSRSVIVAAIVDHLQRALPDVPVTADWPR